ncbi:hypothetical protein FKW77_002632 [Venturia effusa]|uniref:Uncharacterized protein n=1 Tax=Venturia effusa TaxID=50376 RepID=A0A517LDF3_9PEZI|nr:hypothetical protein FKW77_002632 [Venturia effusa]
MCIYSQTTYSCKHNVETLTELCDLGRNYKPSMHDKLIIGLYESKDKCEACGAPPVLIDLTQDMNNPIDLTNDQFNHNGFTQGPEMPPYHHFDNRDPPSYHDFEHQNTPIDLQDTPKKRVRRDSAFDDYPVLPQTDLPVNSHPAPMDGVM